jgi:signal transduction histidine kinase
MKEYEDRVLRWRETAEFEGLVKQVYLARGADLYGVDGKRLGWPEHLSHLGELLASRSRLGPPARMAPAVLPGGDRNIPLLAVPVPRGRLPRSTGPPSPRRLPEVEGWLIAEIDLDYVQKQWLPELVRRHFGADYAVQVIRGGAPEPPVYRSDASFSFGGGAPDATAWLLDLRPEGWGRPAGPGPRPKAPPPASGGVLWEAQVWRRSGSLESMVEQTRIRNLAISGGVLAVLAGSLLLLLATARRAQRLARLQLEFVAGVSHELRTPLSVIRSAGENIADGLVTGEEQSRRYGSLIRDEGRRLTEMVEQILSFSGLEAGGSRYEFQPVSIASVVERAAEASRGELEAAGCRLETDLPDDLPAVQADATSLAHCVRNLISNAVKHGGAGRPVRVRASREASDSEVRVEVEDQGPGIHPADLPYLFDAFYRGRRSVAEQVRGAGLGLTLVKRIVEAHGGSVEASSRPGQGARFTLRLPVKGG